MNDHEDKVRRVSQEKAAKFKEYAKEYNKARKSIPTGFNQTEQIGRRKQRILEVLGGTEEDWSSWHWQMRNRITSPEELNRVVSITPREQRTIERALDRFRLNTTQSASPQTASIVAPSVTFGACESSGNSMAS